jgi:hypothetical protein
MVARQVCQHHRRVANGGIAKVPPHRHVLTNGVMGVPRHRRVAQGGMLTRPDATNYSVVSRHAQPLHVSTVQKHAGANGAPIFLSALCDGPVVSFV